MRIITHYNGDGSREHKSEDGRLWHEVERPLELAHVAPEVLVCVGRDSEPRPARDFQDTSVPDDSRYPLLMRLFALLPVYVEMRGTT